MMVRTQDGGGARAGGEHLRGWLVSLGCHALGVGCAVWMTAEFNRTVVPEPFHWEVSVVEPPPPAEAHSAEAASAPPAPKPVTAAVTPAIRRQPVVPSQEVAQTLTPPVEAQEPVQSVQPEVRVARESVTERPTVQEIARAASAPVVSASQEAVVAAVAAPFAGTVVEQGTSVEARTVVDAMSSIRESEAIEHTTPLVRRVSAPVEHYVEHHVEPHVVQRSQVQYRRTELDYGWLKDALGARIEQLKRYPRQARANNWEGRVVLEVVVRHDGTVVGLHVAESSGHPILDQEALEVMRRASPLALKYPLERPEVPLLVPITYRLDG